MVLQKVDNLYDVAKPLHVFSQLLGVSPFTIQEENQIFVSRSKFINLFCILFLIARNLVTYVLIFHGILWEKSEVKPSQIYSSSLLVLVFSCMTVSLIVISWSFAMRKHFVKILNQMLEIDNELAELKLPINFKRQKILIRVTIAVILVYSGLLPLMFINDKKLNLIDFLVLSLICFSTLEDMVFVIPFTLLMSSVKLRYKQINLFLQINFLDLANGKIQDGKDKLIKAASLHDKLVDVSQTMNQCFGLTVSQYQSQCQLFLILILHLGDADLG